MGRLWACGSCHWEGIQKKSNHTGGSKNWGQSRTGFVVCACVTHGISRAPCGVVFCDNHTSGILFFPRRQAKPGVQWMSWNELENLQKTNVQYMFPESNSGRCGTIRAWWLIQHCPAHLKPCSRMRISSKLFLHIRRCLADDPPNTPEDLGYRDTIHQKERKKCGNPNDKLPPVSPKIGDSVPSKVGLSLGLPHCLQMTVQCEPVLTKMYSKFT